MDLIVSSGNGDGGVDERVPEGVLRRIYEGEKYCTKRGKCQKLAFVIRAS